MFAWLYVTRKAVEIMSWHIKYQAKELYLGGPFLFGPFIFIFIIDVFHFFGTLGRSFNFLFPLSVIVIIFGVTLLLGLWFVVNALLSFCWCFWGFLIIITRSKWIILSFLLKLWLWLSLRWSSCRFCLFYGSNRRGRCLRGWPLIGGKLSEKCIF
jgi:hypothetical protein